MHKSLFSIEWKVKAKEESKTKALNQFEKVMGMDLPSQWKPGSSYQANKEITQQLETSIYGPKQW